MQLVPKCRFIETEREREREIGKLKPLGAAMEDGSKIKL